MPFAHTDDMMLMWGWDDLVGIVNELPAVRLKDQGLMPDKSE
jgi:hypothetical protein